MRQLLKMKKKIFANNLGQIFYLGIGSLLTAQYKQANSPPLKSGGKGWIASSGGAF